MRPLFRAASVSPPPSELLQAAGAIEIEFLGGVLDGASVGPASVVARTSSGVRLSIFAFEQAGRLRVEPAGGSWGTDALVIELHAGLRSLDSDPLSAPVAVPFGVMP